MTVLTKSEPMQAERAVFTSIRSPMGVGYQLVATTPGISRGERQEIVRSAPTHGNLCDDSPDAAGLSSFTLSTGRQCLLLSLHAGAEQTARGGLRVQTHVLVLEADQFARFDWNPLSVETTALAALNGQRETIPTTRLEPLSLHDLDAGEPTPCAADVRAVAAAVSALLAQRRTLVLRALAPRDALHAAVSATPAAARRNRSMSYGVKFSPSRRFDFVVTPTDPNALKRTAHTQAIDLLDWETPEEPADTTCLTWLRLVQSWITAGRFRDLARLTDALRDDAGPATLSQVVQLTDALERVAQAPALELDAMARTHPARAQRLPGYLLKELHAAIESRRKQIAEAEQAGQAKEAEQPDHPSGSTLDPDAPTPPETQPSPSRE